MTPEAQAERAKVVALGRKHIMGAIEGLAQGEGNCDDPARTLGALVGLAYFIQCIERGDHLKEGN